MIKNINIENAKDITANKIIEDLDGLQNEKIHCTELVVNTLRKAINNLKQ